MPTPSSANGAWVEAGTLKTGAITVYGDNQPYGHYSYDQSPQGRLTEEYKAGAAWSTHPKTIQHDYNYSYGPVYRNPQACLSLLGYGDGTMLYLSYAASCNYSIVQTTDEDGKQGSSGFDVDVNDWGEFEDIEIPLD